MLSSLKNHPFAVEAFFERSIVLTFAVPAVDIQPLIPACLEVDTFDNKWGFIAVAMVQTKDLRPKGFPRITGRDFFLIGYRVFVRYTNLAGKRLRGLYILHSETDKRMMEFLGNVFTQYNYTTTDIHLAHDNTISAISSDTSGFKVTMDISGLGNIDLPANSPFSDWKQARRFAGPLPFTFSFNTKTNKVLIVEGVRENWVPIPVKVLDYRFSFLDKMHLHNLVLANAFIITNVPYYWKKGKNRTMESVRKPFQGVLNVVRFNWHYYALSVAAVLIIFVLQPKVPASFRVISGAFMLAIICSSLVSLIVSAYIYDFSALYKLSWVKTQEADRSEVILNVNAGFDETSVLLLNRFTNCRLTVADFYDPLTHTEVSIKRARKAYPPFPGTQKVSTTHLPMRDKSIDRVFSIFSAHEIRNDEERVAFFVELKRVLRSSGQIVVAEHIRDLANFLAFNVGFFHFHSKATWYNTFRLSGLQIEREIKVTPFITIFILEKNGTAS